MGVRTALRRRTRDRVGGRRLRWRHHRRRHRHRRRRHRRSRLRWMSARCARSGLAPSAGSGPTSSATTSTTLRFSPSWVSQLRCSSRPVTIARLPLVRLAATFSPSSAQAGDVEERCLLLPLAVDLVAAVDGEAEAGDATPARGVAQLRVAGQVADEGDGVVAMDGSFVVCCAQAAAPVMPRRSASASGRRMSLWRTMSSARRSERSSSSSAPPGAMHSMTR